MGNLTKIPKGKLHNVMRQSNREGGIPQDVLRKKRKGRGRVMKRSALLLRFIAQTKKKGWHRTYAL